ncbi:MAG: HNH endonuclease [Methanoregulaceae archaeon]|jgi:hypothetical protein|nr:HNH endonuclease [Methanoregulaceae archaeon]
MKKQTIDGKTFRLHGNYYEWLRWNPVTKKHETVTLQRYLWERDHGPIPDGFDVHHKNLDPLDNRDENFELLPTLAHRSLHMLETWKRNHPETVKNCEECGSPFGVPWNVKVQKRFCSDFCQNKAYNRVRLGRYHAKKGI